MKIVSVAIQKGGAGKTTTTINLAAALRDSGKKCLLVDLDPQASLSHSLGISDELEPNIYHLLKRESAGDPAPPEDAIVERYGMNVLSSSLELAGAELELVSVYGREQILSQILDRLDKKYDYVLLDCPPSIGMLTVNALVASHYLLMPVQAEYLSLKGAKSFLRHLQLVKRLNAGLEVLGFVFTRFDARKTMTGEVEACLKDDFGDEMVFEARIRNNIALAKAQQAGMDIYSFQKSSNGAADYYEVGQEFLRRVSEK
ncbi:ParA family protein [Nitrosomonas sp.]|uniref:ParA family protein n=1 Tax=Nitrosomonas sp. TaxID=42353 RepID=UPI002613C007|nr:ParA family protein [Nitrosomonas sp.]MCW5599990.1 ParA family protein [Nitrosomonas sp.]